MPIFRWHAGIIAAGVGARLGSPHGLPKGLTPVAGRPLIDWILDDLISPTSMVIIVNEQATALRDHVTRTRPGWRIRWIVETTPSSMHSFLRVLETLAADGGDGPFLISTVDTIALPGTFGAFKSLAMGADADVTLALTPRIDDDRPLLIDIDAPYPPEEGFHTRILARRSVVATHYCRPPARVLAVGRGSYASAGYYSVRPTVLAEAAAARQANFSALRHFFAHLFDRGYRMSGICMPESVDVDRPEDVARADRLIGEARRAGRRTPAVNR